MNERDSGPEPEIGEYQERLNTSPSGESQGRAQRSPWSWSTELLPGYEIIAVDERDLSEAEGIIVRDQLSVYPKNELLLGDPYYVRSLRLREEWSFVKIMGHRRGRAFAAKWFLREPEDDDDDLERKVNSVLRADFDSDPKAVPAMLN